MQCVNLCKIIVEIYTFTTAKYYFILKVCGLVNNKCRVKVGILFLFNNLLDYKNGLAKLPIFVP